MTFTEAFELFVQNGFSYHNAIEEAIYWEGMKKESLVAFAKSCLEQ